MRVKSLVMSGNHRSFLLTKIKHLSFALQTIFIASFVDIEENESEKTSFVCSIILFNTFDS